MEPTTRVATLDDAVAIQRLNRDDLGYDHPLPAVRDALADALASPRDRVLVAEIDGRVVGYVHGEDFRLLYEPALVNVLGIAVATADQGRGAPRRARPAPGVGRGAAGCARVLRTPRVQAHQDAGELPQTP